MTNLSSVQDTSRPFPAKSHTQTKFLISSSNWNKYKRQNLFISKSRYVLSWVYFNGHHQFYLFYMFETRHGLINVHFLNLPWNRNGHCCSNFRRPEFQEVNTCNQFPRIKPINPQEHPSTEFNTTNTDRPLIVLNMSCTDLEMDNIDGYWTLLILLRK